MSIFLSTQKVGTKEVGIKQAMIMAAGYGERLRPITEHTPKPLIHIGGQPLLDHILALLQQAGIEKIVINTHHLAQQICDYLWDFPSVIISHEEVLLGSGGGNLNALSHFQGQPFIRINADTYWQGSAVTAINSLQEKWDDKCMDALLSLVPATSEAGDYFLDNGHLTYRGKQITAPYTYSGLAILHPRIFDESPTGPFSIVDVCFHKAQSINRLYGHVHQGFWADIGTHTSLQTLQHTNDI